MGLDMYLQAERFVSEYFDPADKERSAKVQELFPELAVGKITKIRAEVGYWRKANAIHNWFVKNIQDGVDDCGDYYVDKEKLEELLELVEKVLSSRNKKDVAESVLPPVAGFFFGSTDVDEYYYEDMEQTKEILIRAINLPPTLELYYHSSW